MKIHPEIRYSYKILFVEQESNFEDFEADTRVPVINIEGKTFVPIKI